ncbi:MAG: hypothetical protein E7580_05610 [Ruminococcaceae bacterium]|nr:hypothetical protein [Oscillospiraceae bacterium]
MDCSVLQFGAKADGVSLDTDAIQKAVDFVSEHGGGKVILPKGFYLSGTIRLRDRVELHLEEGSVLKGSGDLSHYNALDEYPQNFESEREGWSGRHLILAVEQRDIAITGKGIICGNGKAFFDTPHRCKSFNYFWSRGIAKAINGQRPGQMIALVECKNVRICDFTIEDSPCWSLLLHGCEHASIEGITVRNPLNHANTDGIDLDTCFDVSVVNCDIDTGDDAIAIRCNGRKLLSGRKVCEGIRISRCKLASSACGIRFGVGVGEIRDVVCSDLSITRAGSALELMTAYLKRGDANLYGLICRGIRSENVSYPFRFLQWNDSVIRNVSISDYVSECFCAASFESEKNGCISDVEIRDFSMKIVPAPFILDERAPSERGEYAFSAQGVSGLSLKNVQAFVSEACRDEWKGLSRFADCENMRKENCNF